MICKYFLSMCDLPFHFLFWFFFILIIFRERERKKEREGEKHQCVVASPTPPTKDQACNPGMCPNWESKQRPFGSQAGTGATKPHQPGLPFCFHSGVF